MLDTKNIIFSSNKNSNNITAHTLPRDRRALIGQIGLSVMIILTHFCLRGSKILFWKFTFFLGVTNRCTKYV